jgi:hypothetical protein
MELSRSTQILPVPASRDPYLLFRRLARSLCLDAQAALDGLPGAEGLTPEQLSSLGLVRHYLSYLVRLCEGRT